MPTDERSTNADPTPLNAIVRSMRPKQWAKNGLLFAGIFLNTRFDTVGVWLNALAGFAIFCLLSGSVYIINDIKDVEADRLHPKKKKRPIAAGEVSIATAAWAATIAGAGAIAWSYAYGWRFMFCAVAYWILVFGYSTNLKHIVIIDVLALAGGFVLRAMGGIFILETAWDPSWGELPLTAWFLACTMFLALFIALCKRRAEMVTVGDAAGSTRRVLQEYSVELLNQLISMASTLTVVTYALYCMQEKPELLATMPFVLFGVMRFLWHVYRNDEGGAPEILLFKDKMMLACVVFWLMAMSYVLYR